MNVSLIFAGGVGSRMGGPTPKQYLEFNNKPIIICTLEVFEHHRLIDAIVLVCKENWIDYTKMLIKKYNIKKVVSVIPGGETALESQFNGLKEIAYLYGTENVNVLIHDGVRPLVDDVTITKNIQSVEKYGNAITVTKAIETVIRIEDDEVCDILDRSTCRMAKAPQSFRLKDILDVHNKSIADGTHSFIDSASMMLAYGYKLYTVDGSEENIKITTPSDYYMFLGISKNREE